MARTQKTYRFLIGDDFTLDDIFEIQGLGGGDWWEKVPDAGNNLDLSENCRCIRNIKITVIVETPNAEVSGRPHHETKKE